MPRLLLCALVFLLAKVAVSREGPLVFAHFMPWYQAPPYEREYGWHWTMGHFEPGDGKGPLASHYRPTIGPYDSLDPDVLELQMLLMALAGIDGIVVDWYGIEDTYDYARLHSATQAAIREAERTGLQFAICYEDRTLQPDPVAEGATEADASEVLRAQFEWMDRNWFHRDAYLRLEGRPLVFVFGPLIVNEPEAWFDALGAARQRPKLLTLHFRSKVGEEGIFDWPLPGEGREAALAKVEAFNESKDDVGMRVPIVFPGFHDIYKEAGVHDSYGRVESRDGETFLRTLSSALQTDAEVIQIATWNDWGEGTQIEPSEEHGFLYLELLQEELAKHREDLDNGPEAFSAAMALYEFRKAGGDRRIGDSARALLLEGRVEEALTTLRAAD